MERGGEVEEVFFSFLFCFFLVGRKEKRWTHCCRFTPNPWSVSAVHTAYWCMALVSRAQFWKCSQKAGMASCILRVFSGSSRKRIVPYEFRKPSMRLLVCASHFSGGVMALTISMIVFHRRWCSSLTSSTMRVVKVPKLEGTCSRAVSRMCWSSESGIGDSLDKV